MPLCFIPQILHILRQGIYHHCLGKDPEIPQKRDMRESYNESLSFIWKSSKAPELIVDQEQETWHLSRLFYLLTTQDRSDGYKSHGKGKVSKF